MSLIWGGGLLKPPVGHARVSCFSRWGERPLSPLEPSGALSGSLHPWGGPSIWEVGWGRGREACWCFSWLPGLPPTLNRRNADSQEGMASLRAQVRKDSLARMFSCFYPWISQQWVRFRARSESCREGRVGGWGLASLAWEGRPGCRAGRGALGRPGRRLSLPFTAVRPWAGK